MSINKTLAGGYDMQVELNNSQIGNSYAVRKADNKNVEEKSGNKYSSVSEYYTYLENKYSCLTASNYKVTISPAYLEKCIKDPKCAELLEKNLAHLPVSHQNMTAFWSARGAEVVNEQWNFDENGNCGSSTSMYVVSKGSSSRSGVQNKMLEKRAEKKSTPPNYEKRKRLREQFEERLEKKRAGKKELEEQLAEKREKRKAESEALQSYEVTVVGSDVWSVTEKYIEKANSSAEPMSGTVGFDMKA